MHKCASYGPYKLNLWSLYPLTFKCDLDLQRTWTNVLNGTFIPPGEQLCQMILKSLHKCKSYCQGKRNLWPFYHLTFKCDIDLQPTSMFKWFKWHFYYSRRTTVPKYFEIHAEIYKLCPGRIRPDAGTYSAHTPNWSCNNYVSLTASGVDKMLQRMETLGTGDRIYEPWNW